ncbi:MAG TPA: aminotransferase class I/II-fold pyridoxal phosphate-dependent enzyme, partial [Opitutaceae bacterium]|nr:aminotransferase class I/II-fold pyridoxal phosphate-dependent enzyme [Opitutaceae bacterium]
MPPPPLSTWAQNIAPSPTLAIDAKAKALAAAGEDVCGFAAGEPDFDTPGHIKAAAAAALQEGKTKYAATPGIEPLRQAIAAKYAADYGLTVAPGQVVVSPGGKFSCYLAMLAVCSPGDEVVVPAPYWVSYPEMAKLAGAVPRFVLAGDETGFRISAAQLDAAIGPRTRLVVLNSPSNPTGAVYSRAEVEALVEVIVRRNVYLLSDEIYDRLTYDTAHTCLGALAPDRTVLLGGFSKAHAMTGWRVGWICAPRAVAELCVRVHQYTMLCAPHVSQMAAVEALSGPQDDV